MPKLNNCRFCEALTAVFDGMNVVEYLQDGLHIGGIKPTDNQIQELINEAHILEKTSLWKMLSATPRAQAVDMGIKQAKDYDQLLFSKALIYVADVQQSILNAIHQESQRREAIKKAQEKKSLEDKK